MKESECTCRVIVNMLDSQVMTSDVYSSMYVSEASFIKGYPQ